MNTHIYPCIPINTHTYRYIPIDRLAYLHFPGVVVVITKAVYPLQGAATQLVILKVEFDLVSFSPVTARDQGEDEGRNVPRHQPGVHGPLPGQEQHLQVNEGPGEDTGDPLQAPSGPQGHTHTIPIPVGTILHSTQFDRSMGD